MLRFAIRCRKNLKELSASSSPFYFARAAIARAGGVYGSGVPGGIGGYFFKLASKSTITLMAGPAIHELVSPVCGYYQGLHTA